MRSGCLWSPNETLAVSGALLAQAASGVDERTSGESVLIHAEALNKASISTISQLPTCCRLADLWPMLMAKSALSSADSAWCVRIDLPMLVTLQSALEA
jgi:hypothetical protein